MPRIFSSAEPDPQLTWTAMVLYPGVVLQKVSLSIMLPLFPKSNRFSISGFYACDTCPPLDPMKPQELWVNVTYAKRR
jgi:hypothetical protein